MPKPYKKFTDPREFSKLFGNYRFKKSYSDFINVLMQKLYQPDGKWGRLLGVEGNYGIVNTNFSLAEALNYVDKDEFTSNDMAKEIRKYYTTVYGGSDPKWSLLNYVNTHWTSFMHISNNVNYWISTDQIKNEEIFPWAFDYMSELERFKSILLRSGQYLLKPMDNFKTFHKIMGAIAKSNYIGNLGECRTLWSLNELGNVTDVVKSKPGQKIDTHCGVDIRFKLDGVNKTLQCKSFKTMDFREGQYIFSNINSGTYDVDYFSFVNYRNIYLFVTQKDGLKYRYNLVNQSYIFDQRLLKYKIDI